jgi:hypothetical protein
MKLDIINVDITAFIGDGRANNDGVISIPIYLVDNSTTAPKLERLRTN